MSKEIVEKIKETEQEAKALVELAKKERDALIKSVTEELAEEKTKLLKKLKRERNERILRCELQWQKQQEDADAKARATAKEWEEKYRKFFEEAVFTAMRVILENGDIENL